MCIRVVLKERILESCRSDPDKMFLLVKNMLGKILLIFTTFLITRLKSYTISLDIKHLKPDRHSKINLTEKGRFSVCTTLPGVGTWQLSKFIENDHVDKS